MLTVVSAAATATSLTTLERARAMLDFAPEQDATVSALIEQASRAITDYCRRPFALETVREVFPINGARLGVLLARGPVSTITEARQDEEILPSAGYWHDQATGMLYSLGEDGYRRAWTGSWLTVTYAAGYVLPSDEEGAESPTLPASVERAAIRLVGAYLSLQSRDPLVKSETTEGIGSTPWWVPGAGSMFADPETEHLLQPYRRLF